MDGLQKASPETIKWMEKTTKFLTSPELEVLQAKINALLEERDRVFMAQKLSREQLLSLYRGRGYNPHPGDKFWKIKGIGKGRGMYGWQVGKYQHSCHIDDTDIIVTLVIEPGPHGQTYVIEYADMWLDGPIIV